MGAPTVGVQLVSGAGLDLARRQTVPLGRQDDGRRDSVMTQARGYGGTQPPPPKSPRDEGGMPDIDVVGQVAWIDVTATSPSIQRRTA
jgi:hypothetical protein